MKASADILEAWHAYQISLERVMEAEDARDDCEREFQRRVMKECPYKKGQIIKYDGVIAKIVNVRIPRVNLLKECEVKIIAWAKTPRGDFSRYASLVITDVQGIEIIEDVENKGEEA